MSIIQNPSSYSLTNLDKFDEMIESIEKATALAKVGCSTKINELDEATIFHYFSTLVDVLSLIQKLSIEARQDIQREL